jgi:hypothetical protein
MRAECIHDGMVCSAPACDRPARARGLCASHYQQHRRGRPILPLGLHMDRARVPLPGLRVTKECADALERRARRDRASQYDVACEVLERWAKRQEG